MTVPLYNHAAYIGDAIHSVLAQGPVLREVIVIDDGSTDASAQVMAALARKDARIAFRSQSNQGAHAAINAGLRESTGEFLAILNSDDVYAPGRLAALVAALDADPGAALAASALTFLDGAGQAVTNAWYEAATAFRAGHDIGTALVNGNFLMTTSNYLFRRTLPAAIGGFAALRYAHDLDFALRAHAYGHGIVVLGQPLLRYRTHDSNTIAEDHRGVRAEWAIAAAAYLTALWDRPDAPAVDWEAGAATEAVLQRHGLARAVHLCMAYLRRHGGGTLAASPLPEDAAFRARIMEWV